MCKLNKLFLRTPEVPRKFYNMVKQIFCNNIHDGDGVGIYICIERRQSIGNQNTFGISKDDADEHKNVLIFIHL